MKKIGILTYWGVPNYGAWVQAYALNNVIKEMAALTDEVFHIEYLNNIHWNSYYENDIRLNNAFSYNWAEIEYSKKMTEEELENTYFDIFITGSDAIWEFSIDNMGSDIHLIGNNIEAKKIASYAASFGETRIEDVDEWVLRGLKKYSKITVRDEHSKKIVDELLGHNVAEIVLDPSLLYDFSMDRKVKKPQYNNYIVVYGIRFNDEFVESVIRYARERKLEIISIGYVNKWCDRSIKMLELRTFEWLGFIKYAECVATSMFHGLMVGLSFGKQVKFDQVPYVRNRSQTLLELLNIEKQVKDFESMIDYTDVNEKMSDLKEKSVASLKEILTNE